MLPPLVPSAVKENCPATGGPFTASRPEVLGPPGDLTHGPEGQSAQPAGNCPAAVTTSPLTGTGGDEGSSFWQEIGHRHAISRGGALAGNEQSVSQILSDSDEVWRTGGADCEVRA